MSDDSDFLVFSDEEDFQVLKTRKPWKVLIIDDEPDVHKVTCLALRDIEVDGAPLQFEHAYSAEEGRQLILDNPDAALLLLDVVMETDHAGLDLARFVREDANNTLLRIVLRTGQPGLAPERAVIRDYDINDYKEKTELTAGRLYTLAYSTIRAYRDLEAIEKHKRGLSMVISATRDINRIHNLRALMRGVLIQLTSLLHKGDDAALFNVHGLATMRKASNQYEVIAGIGKYSQQGLQTGEYPMVLSSGLISLFERAVSERRSIVEDNQYIGYYETSFGAVRLIYISGEGDWDEEELALVDLFSRNASIAFESADLRKEVETSQEQMIELLGEIVETRSLETGNHVRRVALLTEFLALAYGLPGSEAEMLRRAAPVHDVGKVAIPDNILKKPGRLTDEERQIMQTHASKGFELLDTSERPLLKAAAIIARDHHEKWDGSGYPSGKAGEEIHLYGRLVAAADVYEALGAERVYKSPWPEEKILSFFRDQRGKHFDPKIADLVLKYAKELRQIVVDHS